MKSLFKQAASAACLPWMVAATYRGAVVVEYDGSVQLNAETVMNQAEVFLAGSGLDCTASLRHQFAHAVFNGASFNIKCNNDGVSQKSIITTVQSIDGVGKAWPVTRVEPSIHRVNVPGITDGHITRQFGSYTRRDLSSRQLALRSGNGATADTLSTHVDTGVDKLHAANLTGSGVRIAVVDTGFDYDVPGLSKVHVAFTHDLADNDDDVRDNCSIHGTHVLGIVGATGDEGRYGVNGVAYGATYELYRIQSCDSDSAETDVLINSFLEAANRGVDIITCSFGGSLVFAEDPWSAVATRLFENGTYVSLPAGNGGPGIFTGGSPGAGDAISSTGSADNSFTPYLTWEGNWTTESESGSLRFVPGLHFDLPSNNKLTVWTPNTPISKDCQPVPENTDLPADLSNVILLSSVYQCWKAPNGTTVSLTRTLGIPYALYYTPSNWTISDGPLFLEDSTDPDIKAVLQATDGELVNKLNNRSGNLTSSFSSWGPTLKAGSMPLFLAPGGNILSTFPAKLGGYGVIGGTSMATPFAAGVAALVKQQHPDYTAQQIQAVIATTAQPVKWNDAKGKTDDFLAPVFQQGGGLIDAYNAVHSTTLIDTPVLNFNDTANRPDELSFSIKNTGTQVMTYKLSHVGAASGYVLKTPNGYNLTGAEVFAVYADVSISPALVKVEPGKSVAVSVSISKEPALPDAATRVSYYGGYIAVEAEGSTDVNKLSLPYTGFGAPLTTIPSIDRDGSYLSVWNLTSSTASRIEEGRVFTCTLNLTADPPASFPDNIYPGVQIDPVLTSRNLSIQILDAASGREIFESYQATPEAPWVGAGTWYWDGSDANKTFLPAGSYKWQVRSLRLSGNPEKEKDWDTFTTGKWVLET
ncbi:Minor extracellular protease vpr 13 [Colletotrichum chlorophyti]|uniref:Minor extracellular protease vpr 13 n=1 Tax=Colletotrichum chlorophyti TaxID=708187 RepID=A0A1Q8RE75_9PEZI|nr:Minor extracellular protease vpr 13 [Colletotrichum chlorophyti]